VLSVAVLVLVLERAVMNEPVFDHEKLDVYRLSIEYIAISHTIALRLTGANRHSRDQWLRAAQSVPLNIAEGNGKHSLKDRSRFFDIARGSALECAAIHDILSVCKAIGEDENRTGKSQLRRIVGMLTKLVARNESVSETPSIYQAAFEHEHRCAEQEHEQEEKPEQSDAHQALDRPRLSCV
jgi:four helix bundle protein